MIKYPEYPCCKCKIIDLVACINCAENVEFENEIKKIAEKYDEKIAEDVRLISVKIAEQERNAEYIANLKIKLHEKIAKI